MANKDFTYCNGKGCALRSRCKRYQDGLRIVANHDEDINQYWWMDNCNPEDRDGYIYRHGDTYVVKYESHVQIVEYRKQSLADALVEMLRYLLQYDFTKQQLNLKAED